VTQENRPEDALARALTRAYAAPAVALVANGVALTVMLAKLVPPIRDVYWPTSIELPFACRTVFRASLLAEEVWPWTVGAFVPACWLVWMLARRRAAGRAAQMLSGMQEGAALGEVQRLELRLQVAVLLVAVALMVFVVVGVYQPYQFYLPAPVTP
jgi:hypothetical protein